MQSLRCRRCGYDVTGLPGAGKGRVHCPECGRDEIPIDAGFLRGFVVRRAIGYSAIAPVVTIVMWLTAGVAADGLGARVLSVLGVLGLFGSPLVAGLVGGIVGARVAGKRVDRTDLPAGDAIAFRAFVLHFAIGLAVGGLPLVCLICLPVLLWIWL